jgi:hypothetical protein
MEATMETVYEAYFYTRGPRARVDFSRPVHPGRVGGAHFESDPTRGGQRCPRRPLSARQRTEDVPVTAPRCCRRLRVVEGTSVEGR